MKTLIKNARSLQSLIGINQNSKTDRLISVHLVVENSTILHVENTIPEGKFDLIIDGVGLFLSPGLVDPQVHFREPGMEYKEDIESGSHAAVKGGFTAVVSMPNTSPTADTPEVVAYMVKRAKDVGKCKVYPTGALSVGLKGRNITDFAALKKAGAVAITDDGKGVQSDRVFLAALNQAKKLNLAVLDHSEDESLSNSGSIHEGEVSKRFGIRGINATSESAHVERGCEMSLKTGARYHVLHVSTKASIEAIRNAKRLGANVTVEVSPHHLLLCDEDIHIKDDNTLDANWKMNPPLRSRQDMEACTQALSSGLIDAIATDHAPHSPQEKWLDIESAPFGIIGLETAFPLVYTHFVRTGKITLGACIDLMSKQAGALFNIECGRILPGAPADLCLLDLQTEFEVDDAFFASKSKNSPFIGQQLYGRTELTMTDGKVVYRRA